jgi:molecular chaperone HtpG
MLESYNPDVKYLRIDADIADALAKDTVTTENETLTRLFRQVSGNEELEVSYRALKDDTLPAMLTLSEESRRMEEMMRMYAMQNGGAVPSFPVAYTLHVNTASPLLDKLSQLADTDSDKARLMAGQIYRLSLLAQRKLTAEELSAFLTESFTLLGML